MGKPKYFIFLAIFLILSIITIYLIRQNSITGKVAADIPNDRSNSNSPSQETPSADNNSQNPTKDNLTSPSLEKQAQQTNLINNSNNESNSAKSASTSSSGRNSQDFQNSNQINNTNKKNESKSIVKNITIISPKNNFVSIGALNITFSYSGNSSSCSLYLEEEIKLVKTEMQNPARFDLNLNPGIYHWQLSCLFGNQTLYTKKMKTYVTNITYLEGIEDFENVLNFNIKQSYGSIRFRNKINLSRAIYFEKFVKISHNYIEIESENMTELNKSAILTLENLAYENPVILRNGKLCSDCSILGNNGNLTFSVEHFSAYSATENSRLFIYDSSDYATKYPGQQITFYANFTNLTSIPITGTCNMNFTDTGLQSMTYNPASKMYEYNRSFSLAGVNYYKVGCSGSGYTSIGLTDYASINLIAHPNGANATAHGSERGNASKVNNQTLVAGNVTSLNIDQLAITNYWQGFYGNISGKISLDNAQGNTFYDWNVVDLQGEVFATRAYDVNFATFNCSNSTHIGLEENYLGHVSITSDSVTNTFSAALHPVFSVGALLFPQDSCKATNLYVNGAAGTDFYEVLLSDDAKNMVYTAIIDENTVGYDGKTYDFEMLVGDKGNSSTTLYYFFMELG